MEEIIVKQEELGKRLDSFIASKKNDITRTTAQRLIEKGNILVNNKKVKVSYKILENDVISIIPEEIKEVKIIPQEIPIETIYEDSDIVVVNKPKGMVVHPANGNIDGTLVNAILSKCKDSFLVKLKLTWNLNSGAANGKNFIY